jgi:hypothetical protein
MTSVNVRRKRAAWPILLAFATITVAGRAARADEPAAPPPAGWYGWQTLASDGTAIALLVAAGYLDDAKYTSSSGQTYGTLSNVALGAGFAVYVLGGPTLHALRGHWDKFGGSLAARLVLPVAGTLVGVLAGTVACHPEGDDEVPCPVIGGMLGFAAGGVAAMIVDAARLARDDGPSVTPIITPASGGGVSFTLAGRF